MIAHFWGKAEQRVQNALRSVHPLGTTDALMVKKRIPPSGFQAPWVPAAATVVCWYHRTAWGLDP